MFELFFVRHYLVPKKKNLSVALIGSLSLFAIAIISWLLLMFSSITEGIEKSWLHKLTLLNAPIRIIPTQEYYHSYYYQIDSISANSHYTYKTIAEKLSAPKADPYNPDEDEGIPRYWPNKEVDESGQPQDLVKQLFLILEGIKKESPNLSTEPYEGAIALMQLYMPSLKDPLQSDRLLSQVSYLSSYPRQKALWAGTLEKPTLCDIKYLLSQSNDIHSDTKNILSNIVIKKATICSKKWSPSLQILPKNVPLKGYCVPSSNNIQLFVILTSFLSDKQINDLDIPKEHFGYLYITQDETCYFNKQLMTKKMRFRLDRDIPITISSNHSDANSQEFCFQGKLQDKDIQGMISLQDCDICDCDIFNEFLESPAIPPPWAYFVHDQLILPKNGILLPKFFKNHMIHIGNLGHFLYYQNTPFHTTEEHMRINVVGFYNPGLISSGTRLILANNEMIHYLSPHPHLPTTDLFLTNGIQIWFDELHHTPFITKEINKQLSQRNMAHYWKIIPFYEYEFVKEMMSQFATDRLLFMLVGLLILLVACSSIVSYLLILVNDKKQEIAILLALGATKKQIATIFGLSGLIIGGIGALLGILLTYLTLHNIDACLSFFHIFVGKAIFLPPLYTQTIPHQVSLFGLTIICIAAPTISLIAGLLSSIKACTLQPSFILRTE